MKRRDILIAGTALAGVPLVTKSEPCPPPTLALDGSTASTACGTLQADWNARVSGPGVVWHHNFDSAAEVDQFRWTGGWGNDPTAQGAGGRAANIRWVSSGGVDGGGFLEALRDSSTDSLHWYRPFSPFTGAGNGRGVDDPGPNPQGYNPNNSSELLTYSSNAVGRAKQGWYGHPSEQDSTFEGHDFYIQVRVKMDPRRTTPGNIEVGKNVWLTTTVDSYTAQELVTYGGYWGQFPMSVGMENYHMVYQGYGYAPINQVATTSSGTRIQLGSEISGVCDPYNQVNTGCWAYSGGWDCLLYHITPGTNGGGTNARFEVWAATEARVAAGLGYQKIWDIYYPAYFDSGANSSNGVAKSGWNALILGTYHNGAPMSEFWQRWDQLIFSKQFIPCPQV